ncbi:GNAT family N-acetyltransferase [Rhizohabitans arisaemae]|uniref:GNAT family N-acetyltransferase n=1 Tax=Rhizohabitans arisaemae TaxID=2720610 RepID=UPI0024B0B8D7|nr:GNAT family N-acetyltransferase [Rhizohabitans arisaemae]
MSDSVDIQVLDPDDVDEVGPLWKALHEHHHQTAPHVGEVLTMNDPDESWRRRRLRYAEWLAAPGAFALVAREDGRVLGYTVVRIEDPEQGAMWGRTGRAAVVETLSVLPGARGTGVGGALIGAIKDRVRAEGVRTLDLHVLANNHDAIRFYERHGLRPVVTFMVGHLDAGGPS